MLSSYTNITLESGCSVYFRICQFITCLACHVIPIIKTLFLLISTPRHALRDCVFRRFHDFSQAMIDYLFVLHLDEH